MERPKYKWCREVIEQVRFKPDRDKIWNELIAHIEDRTEDMKSRGYTGEESETRAVAAMGDPAEVGKHLNAVHKPWLGWLWIVSKVLIILVILFTAFTLIFLENIPNRDIIGDYSEPVPEHYIRAEDLLRPDLTDWSYGGSTYTRLAYVEPVNCVDKSDGYTFRVDRAALWQWDYELGETRSSSTELQCFLEITDPWLMLITPRLEGFYAVDDRGNRTAAAGGTVGDEQMQLVYGGMTATPYRYGFVVAVWNVTPEAEWVELRCDRAGRDIVLHIDLPGGDKV